MRKKDKTYYPKSLALVFLSMHMGQPLHLQRIDSFVQRIVGRTFDPQVRHLYGNSMGFHILSSKKRDIGMEHIRAEGRSSALMLVDLESTHPNFSPAARSTEGALDEDEWRQIKQRFGFRCATCGSVEGEPHLHDPASRTVLTRGHMDIDSALTSANTVPQCKYFCNGHYSNRFTFDDRGRVRHLYDGRYISHSSDQTKVDALATIIRDDPTILSRVPIQIVAIMREHFEEEE
ncbi:hypothetical protein OAG22_00460 [Candidatus Poseidoniaceae archaeon]|nr:hypothetical protein [Candidatus Poseidoniaceae archaeon]